MKYIVIKQTKHVQALYAENHMVLMKEFKDINKWRHTMFMDWKAQRSKDLHSTPKDL